MKTFQRWVSKGKWGEENPAAASTDGSESITCSIQYLQNKQFLFCDIKDVLRLNNAAHKFED